MLIADWDDLTDKDIWFIEKLKELKKINPAFKCTVFAIPGKCGDNFIHNIPDWVQIAAHGWDHNSNYECLSWDQAQMFRVMSYLDQYWKKTKIFKFPGWQGSVDARMALRFNGWTLADNPNYKELRIDGLRIYDHTEYGDSAWHGHVANVCGNGLLETWDRLVERVKNETEFKWISEVFN